MNTATLGTASDGLPSKPRLLASLRSVSPAQEAAAADALRRFASAPQPGADLDLAELLDAAPWLPQSELALDAAIDACLAAARAAGEPLEARAGRLMGAHPAIALQIQRAVLLSLALGSSEAGGARPAPLSLPTEIGPPCDDGRPRYELRQLIGTGAQGHVYEAVDRTFSESRRPVHVALKLAHAAPDPRRTRSDADEATRARRINHPAVVRAIDRGHGPDGRPYHVFELIEGQSLDTWLAQRSSPLPWTDAARLTIAIAEGIQAAHAIGLVHLDLKPSNILIDRNARALVTDFGIARDGALALDADHRYSTRGSLAFMPPERFASREGSDAPLADVYGLGGILYWLLTGLMPNGQSAQEAIERLTNTPDRAAALRPRIHRPGLPRELDLVCARALAHAPAARHGSAQALRDDLAAVLAHTPIQWQRPGPGRRAALQLRRHPRAALAVASAAAILFTATWATANARSRAALRTASTQAALEHQLLEARLQGEMTQSVLDERQRSIDSMRSQLSTWLNVFSGREHSEPGVYVAFLEALDKTDIVDTSMIFGKTLPARVEVAQTVLAAAHERGDAGTLEIALWHDLLGRWLLRTDQPAQAAAHLRQAQASLAPRLAPDDPWALSLAARIAAADEAAAALPPTELVNPASPAP